jgi:hypothetical protein
MIMAQRIVLSMITYRSVERLGRDLFLAARSRSYQAVWTVDTRSLYAPWDADFVVAIGRRIGRLAELRLKYRQYLAWLLFRGYG